MQKNEFTSSTISPEKPDQPKQKLKLSILKNIRGMGNFITNSTSFWKDSIDSSFCSCDFSPPKEDIQKSSHLFKITNTSPITPKRSYTKEWTKEEISLLNYNYYVLHKKNFKILSEQIKTKSSQQCYYRIKKYEVKAKMKKLSRQDDLKIISLVDTYGKNWKKISQYFPGYTAEMIEERYKMKLDPKIKRTKFTEEEDEKIMALYSQLGNKWKEIATFFPERNINMVKNRFYTFLKYKINSDVNKTEETETDNNISPKGKMNTNRKSNKNFKEKNKYINKAVDINYKHNHNEEEETIKPFFKYDPQSPKNEGYFNFTFASNNKCNNNNTDMQNDNSNANDLFLQDTYLKDTTQKKEEFFEMYQKVFPISNPQNDDVKMTCEFDMLSLLSNGNTSSLYDEKSLIMKKKNDETQKLFKQAYSLEELLHKIDSFQFDAPYGASNGNFSIENEKFKEFNEQKKKLDACKDKLTNKLNELKEKYANSLRNNKPDTSVLIEINDTLLKMISIGKEKILINKNIRDIKDVKKGKGLRGREFKGNKKFKGLREEI